VLLVAAFGGLAATAYLDLSRRFRPETSGSS
jgi:hypothetical protein